MLKFNHIINNAHHYSKKNIRTRTNDHRKWEKYFESKKVNKMKWNKIKSDFKKDETKAVKNYIERENLRAFVYKQASKHERESMERG